MSLRDVWLVRMACVALALLGCAAAWAGMPPLPVEVAPVTRGPVFTVLPTVGSVRALREVSVGSKLAERVAELCVDDGDPVKKGQVICRLDTTELVLRIPEVKAMLARAEAILADREAGLRENEIKQKEAAVAEERSKVKKLKLDADRVKRLFAQGVVADAERDAVLAEYDTALARLAGAEAALALAREGERKQLIAQARADVAYQEALLALAVQRVKDSTIVSPVDGYVVAKHVEVGEWTQVGGTVVDLIDTSVLRVHTRVTEKQIRLIGEKQKAEVRLDALPGRKFTATVHRIIPRADAATRSFPVQLTLSDPTGQVRAGMFARVSFILGARENVLLVPEDAIVLRGGLAMVFKATPMPMPPQGGAPPGSSGGPPKAKAPPGGAAGGAPGGMPPMPGPMMLAQAAIVTTGARQEGNIEIKEVASGSLDAGDLVVVVGSENMRQGAMMIVVRGMPKQGQGGPPPASPTPAPPSEAPIEGAPR